MNRRSFIGAAIAAAAAAATFDPERALWVPGAKTISVPKPRADLIECREPFPLKFFISLKGDEHILPLVPIGRRFAVSFGEGCRDMYRVAAVGDDGIISLERESRA